MSSTASAHGLLAYTVHCATPSDRPKLRMESAQSKTRPDGAKFHVVLEVSSVDDGACHDVETGFRAGCISVPSATVTDSTRRSAARLRAVVVNAEAARIIPCCGALQWRSGQVGRHGPLKRLTPNPVGGAVSSGPAQSVGARTVVMRGKMRPAEAIPVSELRSVARTRHCQSLLKSCRMRGCSAVGVRSLY